MNKIAMMNPLVRGNLWMMISSRHISGDSVSSSGPPPPSSSPPPPTTPQLVLEHLNNRDLVLIEGAEAAPFLQGLITNDISSLHDSSKVEDGVTSLYTMFLNKAGRVLYDSIIYRTRDPTIYFVECDAQASKDLCRHLKIYRVRKNIKIEIVNNLFQPWVLYNPNISESSDFDSTELQKLSEIVTKDPRLSELGFRFLYPSDRSSNHVEKTLADGNTKINITSPSPKNCYRYHRYGLGIGEGIQDFPKEKCFPLETNADFLNGVSFNKGCYLGQELTARVHHTGVVRKRIMPLQLTVANADVNASTVQNESDANVGTIRGVCEDRALGLLRIEQVLKAAKLTANGHECHVQKPFWWPTIASKSMMNEAS